MTFVLKLSGATPGLVKKVKELRPDWKIIPSMGAFSAHLEVYDEEFQKNFWAETKGVTFLKVLEDDLDEQRYKAVGKYFFPENHQSPMRPVQAKARGRAKAPEKPA